MALVRRFRFSFGDFLVLICALFADKAYFPVRNLKSLAAERLG
jgi:hypothetical protein